MVVGMINRVAVIEVIPILMVMMCYRLIGLVSRKMVVLFFILVFSEVVLNIRVIKGSNRVKIIMLTKLSVNFLVAFFEFVLLENW